MPTISRQNLRFRPSLSFALLCIFLTILWLAGGASKPEAMGQVVVRLAALMVLIAITLFGDRPVLNQGKPVAYILSAGVVLALLQLVPLPPAIWQALPGRSLFVQAAALSGQPQPWRPWAIVPGMATNAAISLVVPVTVLILLAGLKENEQLWLPGIALLLIAASTIVGLLQFSGSTFENPFINDSVGQVSSTFANRNHFALFVAFGCLLAPAWAFDEVKKLSWRIPISLSLILLFVLTIIATGSRGGLAAGFISLGISALLTYRNFKDKLRLYPKRIVFIIIGLIVAVAIILVLLSISSNRALSIDRLFIANAEQDMRRRALPTVWAMIWTYFPAGSGLGGFNNIFRIHEPFALLKPTYFNHAHNDFLEIILDTGLAGGALLVIALTWWVYASMRVWRAGRGVRTTHARVGSAILLLVIFASAFDYPARTPMIMAMITLAAFWLSKGSDAPRPPALPTAD